MTQWLAPSFAQRWDPVQASSSIKLGLEPILSRGDSSKHESPLFTASWHCVCFRWHLKILFFTCTILRDPGFQYLSPSLFLFLSHMHTHALSVHSHYYRNIYSMVSSFMPFGTSRIASMRSYPGIFTQKLKIALNLIKKMLLVVAENKYRIKFDFFAFCFSHPIWSH